jgi:hypothetical protein
MQSMLDRRRRKAQYEQAKTLLAGADPPVDNLSATQEGKTTVAA